MEKPTVQFTLGAESVEEVRRALRDELQQYGEMLALLDQQRETVRTRAANDVMRSVGMVQQQMAAMQRAQEMRRHQQARLAEALGRKGEVGFGALLVLLPEGMRGAMEALMKENAALLAAVRRKAEQNQALLARSVASMERFIEALERV